MGLTNFSSHLSTSLSSFITSSKARVGGLFCILLFQSIGLLDMQVVNEREGNYQRANMYLSVVPALMVDGSTIGGS